MIPRLFVLTALLICSPIFAQGFEQELAHPCKAKLIASTNSISPGQEFYLSVQYDIEDAWHIYWHSPADGAAPTLIDWVMPKGFTASPTIWPCPTRYDEEGFISYGYSKSAFLSTKVIAPSKLPEGEIEFKVKTSWTVCNDICYDSKENLSLKLSPVAKKSSPNKNHATILNAIKSAPKKLTSFPMLQLSQDFTQVDEKSAHWTIELSSKDSQEIANDQKKMLEAIAAYPFDNSFAQLKEPEIVASADRKKISLQFRVKIKSDNFMPSQLKCLILFKKASKLSVNEASTIIQFKKLNNRKQ